MTTLPTDANADASFSYVEDTLTAGSDASVTLPGLDAYGDAATAGAVQVGDATISWDAFATSAQDTAAAGADVVITNFTDLWHL